MFGIYTIRYWTCLPLRDPMTIAKWVDIEGDPDFESKSLDMVIKKVKDEYISKVNAIQKNDGFKDGTECFICYIVKDRKYIIGTVDFDKTLNLVKTYEEYVEI